MLSGTNFNAIREGLHKMTLEGRVGGVTGKGVNASGGANTAVAAGANLLGTLAFAANN